MPHWSAIVVAAGRGQRFGRPKQLVEIAGSPMVAWSVGTFAQMPEIAAIVVVTEQEWLDDVLHAVSAASLGKCFAVVPGGATRQASVYAGLRALPQQSEFALIHDGARPLVRASDVRAGMDATSEQTGAVLAAPVVDTIKRVSADGVVVETLDRAQLWAAQTPQFASVHALLRAHDSAQERGAEATDDAALLECIGVPVRVIPCTPENFKVTMPEDLARADRVLRTRLAEPMPAAKED